MRATSSSKRQIRFGYVVPTSDWLLERVVVVTSNIPRGAIVCRTRLVRKLVPDGRFSAVDVGCPLQQQTESLQLAVPSEVAQAAARQTASIWYADVATPNTKGFGKARKPLLIAGLIAS